MKVILLFTSTAVGGAERSLTRMVAASRAGTIDYRLVTLGGRGAWSSFACALGLEVLCLGSPSRRGGISVSALRRLIALLWRERPEVVYIIGLRTTLYLRLLLPILPRCALVHGIRMNYTKDRHEYRLLKFNDATAGNFLQGWITNTEATSRTLVQELGIPVEKVHVIYNGIDLPVANPRKMPSRLEILTVANFSARKGYVEYLDAITEVVEQYPESLFRFVGRDDLGGLVEREVQRRGLGRWVEILGYRSDPTDFFASATLFVLPSFHEGMPTAILEAMAHAVPVVAFPVDGIVEQVIHGCTGLLVPTGDQSSLAAAIVTLLRDPERSRAMGEAGRQRVESHFSIAHMVEKHAHVLTATALRSRRNRSSWRFRGRNATE